MNEEKKLAKPLHQEYFPLGQGQGISLTVWENSIVLERRIRQLDGNWQTTQSISLAKQIVEKIHIRLPILFNLMKAMENE